MASKPFPYNVPVGSKYGAPMGRPDEGDQTDDYIKLTYRRVPFHDGDYDGGGAYWGYVRGEMLFCAWSADRSVIRYGRAKSYLFFQQMIFEEFPQADFL